MMFILCFIIFLLTSFTMLIMNYYLNKIESWTIYIEKWSPYECGFDQQSHPKTPVSVQFFLISLIFLIFDIEIVYIIPIIPSLLLIDSHSIKVSFIIIIMLYIGVVLEYISGSFNWLV
uniref:NADH-ubiquinone oxidoreductase chain 3 n=1 Tax=Dielis plumipes fossulana TaxID=2977626 RepID=A0A1W5LJN5_9HYME|nr:NADH dehydrogenase subunit 3 [Dielis plumipes fossulana]